MVNVKRFVVLLDCLNHLARTNLKSVPCKKKYKSHEINGSEAGQVTVSLGSW